MKDFKEIFKSDERFETSRDYRDMIIDLSLNACSWQTKSMIIMEELAELTQAVSKMNRNSSGKDSDEYYVLLEEMADVYICLLFLQKHYNIDLFDFNRAMNIKLYRELKRRTDGE